MPQIDRAHQKLSCMPHLRVKTILWQFHSDVFNQVVGFALATTLEGTTLPDITAHIFNIIGGGEQGHIAVAISNVTAILMWPPSPPLYGLRVRRRIMVSLPLPPPA